MHVYRSTTSLFTLPSGLLEEWKSAQAKKHRGLGKKEPALVLCSHLNTMLLVKRETPRLGVDVRSLQEKTGATRIRPKGKSQVDGS